MSSSTPTASSTLNPSSTTTGPSAAATTNNSGSDSPTSKPLLFFVALGFGVVFTNLWIIIGVKYCFRYNQRARAGLLDERTGEPINMGDLPRNRRRREKKLMSMDEVNERFPLTKYKLWRASREQEGLPAAGGVTAPPSRAASIKEQVLGRVSTEREDAKTSIDAEGSTEDQERSADVNEPARDDPSSDKRDFAETSAEPESQDIKKSSELNAGEIPTIQVDTSETQPGEAGDASNDSSPQDKQKVVEDDEDDPIRAAVSSELLDHPGDSCAICIETLEDDDEVRGLTCGHAFHAGCVDPWLTSRRACCPLCKFDYYVPKPRPEGENNADRPRDENGNGPTPLEPVHVTGGQPRANGNRLIVAGSSFTVTHHDRYGFPILSLDRPRRPPRIAGRTQSAMRREVEAERTASNPPPEPNRAMTWIRTLPNNISRPRIPFLGSRRNPAEETPTQQATPGQLEAGTR